MPRCIRGVCCIHGTPKGPAVAHWPRKGDAGEGFPEALFCSIRCAASAAVERCMDAELCSHCGEWVDNCRCDARADEVEDEMIAGSRALAKEVRRLEERESQASKHADAGWMNDVRFGTGGDE